MLTLYFKMISIENSENKIFAFFREKFYTYIITSVKSSALHTIVILMLNEKIIISKEL